MRGFLGFQRRGRRILAVLGVVIVIAGLVHFRELASDNQLLTADANLIPRSAQMMATAVAKGGVLFRENCSACHGVNGRGDRAIGGADLADSDWLYGDGTPAEIERTITYGIRSHHPKGWNLAIMPAFAADGPTSTRAPARLSPAEINDLVAYLLKLQGDWSDEAAAGRGKKIFANTGACFDCHSTDAAGDSAVGGPNLTDRIWLYGDGTPQSLTDSIAAGRAGVCPSWIDRLSPVRIREVALYVYSLSHTPKAGGTALP